ncbi:hypothetical protein FWG86_00085 [Candidatus Saccharibacteria bacterium]|nr:hypothetical protein [Candidatus Saccharibacteria bacterium]
MRDFFAECPASAMTEDQAKALFNEVIGQYMAAAKANGTDVASFVYPKGSKIKFFAIDAEGKLKNASREKREEITNDLLASIDEDDWLEASSIPAGVNATAAYHQVVKLAKEAAEARKGEFGTADCQLNKRDVFCFTNVAKGKAGKAKAAAC